MMQITLEILDRDIRSYQQIDHRYQGEITDQKDLDKSVKIMRELCWDLTGLVGIKDLEAWVGPATAEEHAHFKLQLQERLAILGSTHRITVFMYWTMSLADSLNEDYELYKLCMDRSIIQLLLDDYALPETTKWISSEDLAELDADIRKTGEFFGERVDPSMVPDGFPASHWWWRYPENPA